MRIFFTLGFSLLLVTSAEASNLSLLSFNSPQESLNTFYRSMRDYSKGISHDEADLQSRILDALEAFDPAYRKSTALGKLKDEAVYVKEILDRIGILEELQFTNNRVSGTNIFFIEKDGWFYISSYSLSRSALDFEAIKELPYVQTQFPGAGHRETWIEKYFPEGKDIKYFGITQLQWVSMGLALLLGLLLYFVTSWILFFFETFLLRRHQVTKALAEALTKPVAIFVCAFFLKGAGKYIDLTNQLEAIWSSLTGALLSIGIFWALYSMIGPLEKALVKVTARTESELDDQLVPLVIRTSRVVVVLLAILTIIQGLGVNVFSLLAGLGVGGLAIALAAKDTAANFFGSLMILFDQPFKIGDWIKVGDLEGTVEEIGFRSTRVRTFYDSQIVIPNSTIANSDIDNLGRRQFRRTLETLGVTYSTSREDLNRFIEGVKEIIKTHPKTRKDKYYVSFQKFGDSALEILLYYFLDVPSYQEELESKQELYFKIKSLAEEQGVEFAFPSQSVYLEKSEGIDELKSPE